MLDAYLENEAQQISDRVAVFSKCTALPVSYQLPSKSSSYVVTLDSLLKARSVPSNKSHSKPPEQIPPRSPVKESPSIAVPLSPEGFQHQIQAEEERLFGRPSQAPQHVVSTPQASSFWFVSRYGMKKQTHKSSHSSSVHNPMISVKDLLLQEMGKEAMYHGKVRTHVTAERAAFALTSLPDIKVSFI